MRKRLIIIIVSVLIILGVISYIIYNNLTDTSIQETTTSEPEALKIDFTDYNNNIVSTPLLKDSIAPIDDPKYVTILEADAYLGEKDKVFVYEAEEGVFIYPQKILVWHEVVNEIFDGKALSVTYCPLTGSAICYSGDTESHKSNTYGTSGKLVNSNLLMYDRDTDSYIPQILGVGINNTLKGVVLETQPILWANWEDAKKVYDVARVLSIETGFQRNYYLDPYGSYEQDYEGSYYQNDELMFDLMNDNDGTFHNKKVVVGVKYSDYVLAIDPLIVEEKKVLNFQIGGKRAVAFYDESLKAVRVFDPKTFEFEYVDDKILDQEGNIWQSNGTSDGDRELKPLTYFDVMWFAWHAYYPDTIVIK